MAEINTYCNSLTQYSRFKSREVNIGDIPLGGNNPIRIQSMTTTDTMDTIGTVNQAIRMIEAGCEYVRITAPSIKEAKNLSKIKSLLNNKGYKQPIIADIHFTPKAAMEAAKIVEKIRINPGNFADRKKFQEIEYTDSSYNNELERIHDKFYPLVARCKLEGCSIRIGANHGSLSDRILSRYGDTPRGMVESAMEFLRICVQYNFHDIVLSMKASNTRVMVQAYRLLVYQMKLENMNYPLHLGVTEAGEGEDGRIKSAVGIGTLLEDGLGDTIRVSLTEEPEYEIPVAKELVKRYQNRASHEHIENIYKNPLDPFSYNKRKTDMLNNIGNNNVPRVIVDISYLNSIDRKVLNNLGYTYYENEDKWGIGDFACDYIFIGDNEVKFNIPGTLNIIQSYSRWIIDKDSSRIPLLNLADYLNGCVCHPSINFLNLTLNELSDSLIEKLIFDKTVVLIIETDNKHGLAEQRKFFIDLLKIKLEIPVIIKRSYSNMSIESFQLHSATDFGGLLIDGLGDGIFISSKNCGPLIEINHTSFGILQASRTRISKTEYISCPSCGRTLFDLQETTAMIRSKTSHLKGVKIGIMGCIVNGPGEMADADYGYVGTGVGKISLYRGQNVVESNVSSEDAVQKLIQIMKDDEVWIEPDLVKELS